MAHYIMTVIDWSIIGLLGFMLGFLKNISKKQKEKTKRHENELFLQKQAILALCQSRLQFNCQMYLDAGEITTEELKVLENLYKAYHAMGGNGVISELYERCISLPIKINGKETML